MPNIDVELTRLGSALRTLAEEHQEIPLLQPLGRPKRSRTLWAVAAAAAAVLAIAIPVALFSRPPVVAPPTSAPVTTTTIPDEPHLGVFLQTPVPSDTLLIAGDGAIIRDDGSLILDLSGAEVVTGDGKGGLLIQKDGDIWWLKPNGTPSTLVAEGVDEDASGSRVIVELHDGLLIGGVSHALFVRTELSGDSAYPQVIIANLETGTEHVYLEEVGFEGGVTRVSVGGDQVAYSIAAEGESWVELVPLDETVDFFGEIVTAFSLGTESIDAAMLSRDGQELLCIVSSQDSDGGWTSHLVWWDVSNRVVVRRVELPATEVWNEYWAARIDTDGSRVVVTPVRVVDNRWRPGQALVVDVNNLDQLERLSAPGSAMITK